MFELFKIIIVIGFFVWLAKGTEWRSNHRTTPLGYEHDWNAANVDIALYGKDYYHQQNLKGKYDIPKKEVN